MCLAHLGSLAFDNGMLLSFGELSSANPEVVLMFYCFHPLSIAQFLFHGHVLG